MDNNTYTLTDIKWYLITYVNKQYWLNYGLIKLQLCLILSCCWCSCFLASCLEMNVTSSHGFNSLPPPLLLWVTGSILRSWTQCQDGFTLWHNVLWSAREGKTARALTLTPWMQSVSYVQHHSLTLHFLHHNCTGSRAILTSTGMHFNWFVMFWSVNSWFRNEM